MSRLKLSIAAFTLAISACTFTACQKEPVGNGPVKTEQRTLTDFHGIHLRVDANVIVTLGASPSLSIEAEQNVIDVIESQVIGGVLLIEPEYASSVNNTSPITIRVTAPSLNNIKLDSQGNIMTQGIISGSTLTVTNSGEGSITMEAVNVDRLNTSGRGSGQITIENGTADDNYVELLGSGDIDLRDVSATYGNINLSGTGDVYINASNRLDINISGSGDVYYRGTPVKSVINTGSGSISSM